jgi:very-short-patch-repair endonuclease
VLDKRLDGLRDEALLAAGWREVLRVREDDIWHRPWLVVEEVRRARRRLRLAA